MLKFIVGNKTDLLEEIEESKDRNECVTEKMLRYEFHSIIEIPEV